MKNNNLKKDLQKDIKFIKSAEHEELYRVFSDALDAFFKSLVTFGLNNPYTKECFKVVKEMKEVLKEEKRLLVMLENNIDHIRLDDLDEMIGEIDEVGEDAYLDYSDILDNIYIACQEKDKERIVRSNKPINSVLTNNEYEEKVIDLVKRGSFKK